MKTATILVFLLLGGCSSTGSSSTASSSTVVKTSELPASHRAVLEAWKKGGAAWEIERERVRADPQLSRFVVDNLLIEMVQAFDRSRLARPGEVRGPFERAQDELVALGDRSAPVLVAALSLQDGVVAFLAADTLTRIGVPALEPTCGFLADDRAESRRRAAELLERLPHAGDAEKSVQESLAERVSKDPEWIVRGQAVHALAARGSRHDHKGFAMGVLLRALEDEDDAVAEAAAQGLGVLGEPRALERMRAAQNAASGRGRVKVVEALRLSIGRLSAGASR